jgi:hypothetical protein
MPRIIVTADPPSEGSERPIMFTERVSVSDFESPHFQTQLVERLGWAVGDADAVEQGHSDDYDYDDDETPSTRFDGADLDEPRHDVDSSDEDSRQREVVLSGNSS